MNKKVMEMNLKLKYPRKTIRTGTLKMIDVLRDKKLKPVPIGTPILGIFWKEKQITNLIYQLNDCFCHGIYDDRFLPVFDLERSQSQDDVQSFMLIDHIPDDKIRKKALRFVRNIKDYVSIGGEIHEPISWIKAGFKDLREEMGGK